jgi:hypothetical protein
MAGGSAHHLAQRQHRRAEHAGRGPPCAHVRLRDLRWHRRDRWLRRGGAVRGWAQPGDGRARIRMGCGWFGHGVFPGHVGVRRSALGGRWVSGRPERCDEEWAGARTLADAQQGRRQLPAAAAQGGRYRAGPVAGTGRCTQAEPPVASWPLLSGGMTGGGTRPGQGRLSCGLEVAGIHRVIAPPGQDPGPAASIRHRHRQPGRGISSVMVSSDCDDRADAHELLR